VARVYQGLGRLRQPSHVPEAAGVRPRPGGGGPHRDLGRPAPLAESGARDLRTDLVFTCSWSDWFHEAADPWRDEAWAVVRKRPNLPFQVLTKRPERIRDHLPADWGDGYDNVWLGVSVERDDYCRRVDVLRAVPAKTRWVCAEPLLGSLPSLNLDGIHWVVCGGESGPGWRPMDPVWARNLRDKCRAAGVPFDFKQSNALYPGTSPLLDGELLQKMPEARRTPLTHFG
jgi:protein gp37